MPLSLSSACKPDQALWRARQVSCHLHSPSRGRNRQPARRSNGLHTMRRAPSLNSSKNRVTAKENDNDIAMGTNSELRTRMSNSPQSKTKMQKSSFTVFGLQPSPELLSISMGRKHLAGQRTPSAHAHVMSTLSLLCFSVLCARYTWTCSLGDFLLLQR